MNENVYLAEVDGLDFVSLGDATEETKQVAPSTVAPDSTFGWGWPAREPV